MSFSARDKDLWILKISLLLALTVSIVSVTHAGELPVNNCVDYSAAQNASAVRVAFKQATIDGRPASRFALVIGNDLYSNDVGVLKNARNDARIISQKLATVDFDVLCLLNANGDQIKRGVSTLADVARPGTVVLFYFAGHGVSVKNENWIAGIDAKVKDAADLQLWGVNVRTILEVLLSSGTAHVILLFDSCRNPLFFPGRDGFRAGGETRQGFAYTDYREVHSERQRQGGFFMGFSTGWNALASDGKANNGLFTGILASNIGIASETLAEVFKRTADAVTKRAEPDQEQRPEKIDAGGGDEFIFRSPVYPLAELRRRLDNALADAAAQPPTCYGLEQFLMRFGDSADPMATTLIKTAQTELMNCYANPQKLLASAAETIRPTLLEEALFNQVSFAVAEATVAAVNKVTVEPDKNEKVLPFATNVLLNKGLPDTSRSIVLQQYAWLPTDAKEVSENGGSEITSIVRAWIKEWERVPPTLEEKNFGLLPRTTVLRFEADSLRLPEQSLALLKERLAELRASANYFSKDNLLEIFATAAPRATNHSNAGHWLAQERALDLTRAAVTVGIPRSSIRISYGIATDSRGRLVGSENLGVITIRDVRVMAHNLE